MTEDVPERLAGVLLTKWKREWAEEAADLPASVDPEFLSPVTDTSHGEMALEYAVVLLPVAQEMIDEARDEGWREGYSQALLRWLVDGRADR